MRTARYWIVGVACGAVAVVLIVVLFVVPSARVAQQNKDRVEAIAQVAHLALVTEYNRCVKTNARFDHVRAVFLAAEADVPIQPGADPVLRAQITASNLRRKAARALIVQALPDETCHRP